MVSTFHHLREKFASFGPGLLYAGAAVGVSHLVQSTRAGAEFGYQLLIVVIVANLIKYPIFESGPRYAAATGETLLDGYHRLGRWAVWLYVLISLATMFIVMAAISIVTAGLCSNFLNLRLEAPFVAVILLLLSTAILGIGHYNALDRLMKVIVILLTVSTVCAVVFGLFEPLERSEEYLVYFDLGNRGHMLFLVALIGWMPAPVDITIWHSVWSISKNRSRGSNVDLRSALQDFRLGYWGTMVIAVSFVMLGAMVMYGTENRLASDGVTFASQIVEMYTSKLGAWTYPVIALAAFTTMFSTLLTCLDAFPRTLRKSTKLLFPRFEHRRYHVSLYWFWILFTVLGTSMVLLHLLSNMKQMVDMATTLSFVVAPVLAVLNFIVTRRYVSPDQQSAKWLQNMNLVAIVLLTLFSIWFILY